MFDTTHIRDLDDKLFDEFKEYSPLLPSSNFSKQYPKTLHLTNVFSASTNFIKNSIFDGAENDSLFACKILFRSLIEHFLRFNFLWLNWIENRNDEDAKRYLDFTKAGEILSELKSEVEAHKLSNPNYSFTNWDQLLNEIPSCKGLTKSQIEQEAKLYTYKNIIRRLKAIADNNNDSSFSESLIREYSKLSSFVHGGSDSHITMLKFHDEEKRSDEYKRICELSFQLSNSVKLFTLIMLVQTDRENFERFYLKVHHLVKQI